MNALPPLPSYLNGEFTELPDAKISVMDRGFIFGDGVYEVVPVYGGRLFRFEQHMARLDRSLTEVRIANPMTQAQWAEVALKLVSSYAAYTGAKAENINQLVYIQITRGVAMRDHVMPTDITPTVFVMANKMNLPTDAQRSQGVVCVTADDFRWEKAHIKSTSLLGSVLARQISFDAGAVETIMFRDGFLSEAAASNVWVIKDGKVLGTPKDNLVLEGIRYRLLEEICRSKGIDFELRRVSRDEVVTADELLLSSATKEVLAVTTLDGRPVGAGRPGPVYAQLYAGYQKAKEQA
ncbi:branched chain amino acid: 2-keto-4-methylthiobutyrate aminotransferase [Rhodoferax ferrireducens T118]|uniref:Branched chain amino acid: 2-keto-4-methylthiobutyrate aminotransferase n=1 Tax=Albidiferax ferrireducens (strain ATCC BAA-621 / DSM 15236 / T118) TaxID=338969 RepID=Q21ZM4_ALBFT|nr:D-amino acid aminotransferase [Rhodoferax ferrireducens]ABD68779.1 branched chain amino acid: 2-keto-4-methylthiobutyrate aminotransferase [Rhodoferax ferrireducens T118]